MDLSKTYPRSVKELFAGVVMLGRTTDKARAYSADTLGEYRYDCPMDQEVFEFLGLDADEYAQKASELDDSALERWVRENYSDKKSAAELSQFNARFMQRKPTPGSEGEKYFSEMRDSIDPSRTDITTWPDLLDLDEGRDVPRRAAA